MSLTDIELDALVARSTYASHDIVAGLDLADAERELCAAILSTTPPRLDGIHQPPLRLGRFWRRRMVAAFAAVGILAAIAAIGVSRLGNHTERAFAAEAIRVAEGSPRLLLDKSWRVTRVDEFSATQGEMTFGRGGQEFDLHWRPGPFASWVDDRKGSADLQDEVAVLGRPAVLFRYGGHDPGVTGRRFTALWELGASTIEFDGFAASRASFEMTLRELRQVSVDEWLLAMPSSVVTPTRRAEVVTQMLRDIPIPQGLDVEALKHGPQFRDRYQLGAQVAGAVACEWFQQWFAARDAHDATAKRQAEMALATARDWAILREMAPLGDYPAILWQHADIANGEPPRETPTRDFSFSGVSGALGCDRVLDAAPGRS